MGISMYVCVSDFFLSILFAGVFMMYSSCDHVVSAVHEVRPAANYLTLVLLGKDKCG